MSKRGFHRRSFLKTSALGAGSLFLGSVLPDRALAQATSQRGRFVFAYFDGGWDVLLGLDPRPPGTNAQEHGIQPGYDQLAGVYQQRGVQRRGNLSFGPAVPPEFLQHAGDFSIINAVTMDTASHEVGRRYFITGRFPRGITAVGSSTPAEIVAQQGDHVPIPHLSAAVEAYATGLPPYAAALSINAITDIAVALTPFVEIDPQILAAIERYQDDAPGCEAAKLDRDGLTTNLIRNQKRARSYITSDLDRFFDVQRADPEMAALRELYGISGQGAAPDSPEMLALVAGQALKEQVSDCVSVRIAHSLDTHSNWAQDHAPRQERGWRALAALVSDLKAKPDPDGGGSMFDNTTFVVFSEFARTPMFNNLQGRDHFLGNSCLVAGPGLRRGRAIGRSASVGMMPLMTELASGEGIENPTEAQKESGAVQTLTPKHVLATVLDSVGLDYAYLRSEPITALRT